MIEGLNLEFSECMKSQYISIRSHDFLLQQFSNLDDDEKKLRLNEYKKFIDKHGVKNV